MKSRLLHWWEALIGGILTMLGFSGCGDNIIDFPVEYGTPQANYKVMGEVSDTKGNPVKGIRVIFAPNGNPTQRQWDNDTLYSDNKGHFELSEAKYKFGMVDDNVTFLAEDVDGNDNGSFKSKTVMGKNHITVTNVKSGRGNWYSGDYVISTKITLEENAE